MSDVVPIDISPDRENHIKEFLQEYVMRVNKKRTKQLMAMSFSAFEAFKLSVRVSRCCRALDLDKAYQFYLDTKALNVVANESTFSNLLSLVAGLGEQGSGQAIVRMTEPPHNIDAAFVVYNDMKANNIPLNESNYSALIRCCSIHHRSQDALQLYNDLKACNITPKLRSFTPLLTTFGREGNLAICKQIWQEMTQQYSIPPTEKEYTIMLRLSVTLKDKKLFYETFEAFKEDIPQPATLELIETLTDFFQTVESDFIVAHSLVTATGVIEFNGERLLSIEMEPETRQHLLSQLDTFAVMRDEVNRKFKPNNKIKEMLQQKKIEKASAAAATTSSSNAADASSSSGSANIRNTEADDAARQVKWDQFKSFLASRQFDVIVDGANVGYYKQNYVGAPPHVDYGQIDQMVRHLMSQGKRPLLILHCRHLHPNMVPNNPTVHAMIKQWETEGFMYATPKGFNDDWFWLYVAVAYQCKVVTNDEMRDHHFQMLAPRWFSRWKERNQVHFDFTHCPRVFSFNSLQNLPAAESERIKDTAEVLIDGPSEPTGNCSDAVESSNSGAGAAGKLKYKFVNKVITMHWPAPYSHRVQHIVSLKYEGFYIPPFPPKAGNSVGDEDSSDGNGGSECGSEENDEEEEVVEGEDDVKHKERKESNEDHDQQEEEEYGSSELWCLFYRPVGSEDAAGSNKRDRSDSGNKSAEDLHSAKQAKN